MTEVISLLESCKTEAAQAPSAPDGAAKTLPLRVFDNSPLKRGSSEDRAGAIDRCAP